jgi:hypothetical protein
VPDTTKRSRVVRNANKDGGFIPGCGKHIEKLMRSQCTVMDI